jgi:hypothetical protein
MIIDFSGINHPQTMGSGQGKHVDLCPDCKYFLHVHYRSRLPTPEWLTGAKITEKYGNQDVKISIHAMTRCASHASPAGAKMRQAFLEAAIKSGIDVMETVDDFRSRQRLKDRSY